MNRIMLAFLFSVMCAPTIAQEPPTSAKKKRFYVAFRMEDWKAKHINDAAQAKTHADTLKTLGCEVKTSAHAGHMDVQCRTVFWKSLALDTHDQAHQWVTWLKSAGFDIIHGHKAGTEKKASPSGQTIEVVKYRSTEWRSQHIHDATELNQLLALYRGLGLEVETSEHSGHSDVKARCVEWMEIELPSHDAAHKWQEFLKSAGFETQHEH